MSIIIVSRKKNRVLPYKIPGILHYREAVNDLVRLYISNKPATYRAIYEVPMVNVLRRIWPAGEIYRNFSVAEVGTFGVRYLFELDAVAFDGNIAFVFEIKNKAAKEIKKMLLQMWNAVKKINNWYAKEKEALQQMIPILYFREKTEENSDMIGINTLHYSDVCEKSHKGEKINLKSFEIAYPLNVSQDEFQHKVEENFTVDSEMATDESQLLQSDHQNSIA